MKNTRTSGLLAMSLLLAAGITAPALATARMMDRLRPTFRRYTPKNRYPEQSKRQANRRYRRAQGGPGLDSNNDPRN